MSKRNIRQSDPAHYARVSVEQEELRKRYSSQICMARLCPFCGHKVEILCRGTHSGTYIKCPNCGEEIFFPPVSFRRT
ncbi:MAG: hypothetical protein HFF84_11125 [Oscillibacter sp.]|nr:hypothetical protein [Oscillibacter sp.]